MNGRTPANKAKDIIVIADDDPSVRLLLKHILEKDNFTCIEADNGQTAIDICNENKVDMVLLDAVMPGVNGFHACQQLKETFPDLPTIIITSLDDDNSVEEAFRSGADDYVTKPINWSVLKHRIARARNNRSQHGVLNSIELNTELDEKNYIINTRARVNLHDESLTAVITNFNQTNQKHKRLLGANTKLSLKHARQLVSDSCKLAIDNANLAFHVYPFSGNPLKYTSMLVEVFNSENIDIKTVDCIFDESLLIETENKQLYNAISELPINIHISKFSFSLHTLDMIKNNRCNAIELDMPLIHNTLDNNQEIIDAMLQPYQDMNFKFIAADITTPDELTLAKKIGCVEAHGPSLGIGLIKK